MNGPPDAAALSAGLSEHRAGDFTLESGETLRDVRQRSEEHTSEPSHS